MVRGGWPRSSPYRWAGADVGSGPRSGSAVVGLVVHRSGLRDCMFGGPDCAVNFGQCRLDLAFQASRPCRRGAGLGDASPIGFGRMTDRSERSSSVPMGRSVSVVGDRHDCAVARLPSSGGPRLRDAFGLDWGLVTGGLGLGPWPGNGLGASAWAFVLRIGLGLWATLGRRTGLHYWGFSALALALGPDWGRELGLGLVPSGLGRWSRTGLGLVPLALLCLGRGWDWGSSLGTGLAWPLVAG